MQTTWKIHPEWLPITITRFRNWQTIGYIIHINPDGSYQGIRDAYKEEKDLKK